MGVKITKKNQPEEKISEDKVSKPEVESVTIGKDGVPVVKKKAKPLPSKGGSKKSEAEPELADVIVDDVCIGQANKVDLVNMIDKKMVTGKTTKTKKPIEMHIQTVKKDSQGMVIPGYEKQVLGEVVSEEPMCNVGFKMGGTTNTGNYENLRYDVTVHIPCKEEDLDKTFDKAKAWVDGKLCALVEELTG